MRRRIITVLFTTTMLLAAGCSLTYRMERRGVNADISLKVPEAAKQEEETSTYYTNYMEFVDTDSVRKFLTGSSKDSGGQYLSTVNIEEVTIVARSKSVAERMGEILIDFIIRIPADLQSRNWAVCFTPVMLCGNRPVALEKIVLRGEVFSELQQRQYWQLNRYLNNILGTDSYEKDNNSLTAKYYAASNALPERGRRKLERVWRETVSYPLVQDSRLNLVVKNSDIGAFEYYYTQSVKTKECGGGRLRVWFEGSVSAIDRSGIALPASDTLDYVVSSLVSLIDTTTVYRKEVISKYETVSDNYFITFPAGGSAIAEDMGSNREELGKMVGMLERYARSKEFRVDSLIITSSASPEGSYKLNDRLSRERGAALKRYLAERAVSCRLDTLVVTRNIAENWPLLIRLIEGDSLLAHSRSRILAVIAKHRNPDRAEREVMRLFPEEYDYMRKALYPLLRSVNFRYRLNRVDMVQDTVITDVPDTEYMEAVALLRERQYTEALQVLAPYRNRNTAIALLSLGYDGEAYRLLSALADTSGRTEYLLAVAAVRTGREREGYGHYLSACRKEPMMAYRAKLDPEIQSLLKQFEK